MVGIVSGNGTGLNLTTSSSMGQRGTLGQATSGRSNEQATVNIANGNFVLQDLDAMLFGRGGDVGVVRTYNSQGTLTDDNGDAWQLSGYRRLIGLTGTVNTSGSTVQRVDADGSVLTYTYDSASGQYKATGTGKYDTLSFNATTQQWTWTEASTQNTEVYGANGSSWRLLSQRDTNGNTVTFNYTGNLLSSIVDANGESVVFTYSGNNLAQESIHLADGTAYSNTYYRYDAQNRLQQVKVDLTPNDNSIADGAVYVTSYSYLGTTNLVTSVVQTDGSQLNITYATVNGQSRVASITDALGRSTQFTYDTVNLTTSVRDALGNTSVYQYDTSNRLVKVTAPTTPGSQTGQVSYTYDSAGNLASVIDGNQTTTYTYDANGNLTKKKEKLAESTSTPYVTETATYNSSNQIVVRTLPRKPVSGMLILGDPPPAGSEFIYYVYDTANNLRFQIGADGDVTEYRYDAYGQRTSTINYLQAQYTSGGSSATLSSMTSWAAARNQALTTRTDYRYNSRGQLTGTTAFANVASDGTGVADGTQSVTSYTYDASGNLLLKVDPNNNQTSFVYDGLNRLLATTNALGQTSTNQYDDADHIIVHRQFDGRVDTQIFDTDGELVSSIVGGIAQSEYRYDALGRMVMSVDPTGVREFYVYDQAGNLQAEVNGNGNVTQYVYNAMQQLVQTIRHSVTLTATQLSTLQGQLSAASTAMPATPASTIAKWSAATAYAAGSQVLYGGKVYSAVSATTAGIEPDSSTGLWTEVALPSRVRTWSPTLTYKTGETVSFGGATYQASAQNVGSIPGSAGSSWTLVTAAPTQAYQDMSSLWPVTGSDQVSYRLYNSLGMLARTVDGAGHVVDYTYDGVGNLTKTIAYATAVSTSGLSVNSTPASVTVTSSAQDRISYRFYDASNRLVMTVDPENYAVEYRYDTAGRNTDVIRYATALSSVPQPIDVTVTSTSTNSNYTAPVPATSAADQHSYLLYDAENRVTGAVDPEGYLTEYMYDAASNVTTIRRYASKIVGSVTAGSTVASLRPADATSVTEYTTNTYDALNRLHTSLSSASNSLSTMQYDVAGNLVSVTTADAGTGTPANGPGQRILTSRYDSLGRVTGILSGRGGLAMQSATTDAAKAAVWAQYGTTYAYDAAGRRISAVDPNGNKTLYYYDQAGHLTQTINALGEVQENRYDAMGQLTGIVRYGTRIATSTLAGLTGGLASSALSSALAAIVNAAVDSKTSVSYNLDGTVASTSDALGLSTSYTYDAFGDRTTTNRTWGYQPTYGATLVTNTETTTFNRRGLMVSDSPASGITSSYIYDAFGRVVSSTDARGATITAAYDRLGRVVSITDPTNATSSTSYDAFGNALTQTDALGNVTTYQFNLSNRTTTVTTPEGVVYKKQSDFAGEPLVVTDGNGNVTSYYYDEDGNLTKTTLNGVVRSTAQYDGADRLTSSTDANGVVTSYTYDAANRVLTRTVDSATGGLNLKTTYAYDAKGEQLSVTDPAGIVTQYSYDLGGHVVKQTVDPSGLNLVTTYEYSTLGKLMATNKPGGGRDSYSYDPLWNTVTRVSTTYSNTYIYSHDLLTDNNGNVTGYREGSYGTDSSADLNRTTALVRDGDARVVYTVDPVGRVTENTYDAAGRIIRVTTYAKPISKAGSDIALNSQMSADYQINQVKQLIVATPGQDMVENRVYDKNDRLRYTVDANGSVTAYNYDGNGNVIERVTYANRINMSTWTAGTTPPVMADAAHDQRVRTVYDAVNRPIYTIDGRGAVTAFTYDANGNVTDEVVYAHTIPTTTAANQSAVAAAVSAVANAGTDIHLRNVYDKANRLTWSANAVGAVTQYVYDADGHVVKQVKYATAIAAGASPSSVAASSDDRVTLMGYDNAGRLAYQVNTLGAVTRYYYDSLGNLTQTTSYARPIAAPSASSAAMTVATLDATVSADAVNDRTSYRVYDQANRLAYVVGADDTITQYSYDGANNLTSTLAYATSRLTPGTSPGWGHVPTSAQVQAVITTDATRDRLTQGAYDGSGKLVYSTDAMGYVTEYKYDGRGVNTSTIRHGAALAAGTPNTVAAIASALSASSTADDRSVSYTYDASGALTTVTDALGYTERYQYDGAGRRTSYTNQNGATWTYAYDAAGNMVSETSPMVALASVSTDGSGNLIAGSNVSAALVTTMTYDALGNLISRTEASGRPEARTTSYVYDALGRQVKTIYPSVSVYNEAGDSIASNGMYGYASRTETTQQPYTQTYYDTLGNAVGSRDVAGNMSYKTYDRAGQVVYDVDAMGYVTSYSRNAFGNATTVTRYATASGLSLAAGVMPTTSQVSTTMASRTSAQDRVVSMTYDTEGRVLTTTQPQTWVSNGTQGALASQVTKNIYNAFGQVTQTQVLADSVAGTWNTTTYLYDRDGRTTATVDSMGYVTQSSYDAVGNLVRQTQYANASTSWSPTSFTNPTASQDDRAVVFAYDKLNRKISETHLSVQFSDGTNDVAGRTRTRGDVTTTYAYDAVGNQTVITDALGNKTYKYYDALGRVTAVALPALTSTLGGAALTPLSEFRYDALGNIVTRIDYARGASFATVGSYGYAGADSNDRQTLSRYDVAGNLVQKSDASGANSFYSYDVQGHLRKQWQTVTDNDGAHTLFTAYRYDALGRQIASITPASTTQLSGTTLLTYSQGSAGVVTVASEYNAFGEMTRQGVNGGRQVYFDYDNAGHMWRTNSGSGVDTVFIYDLQGRQTVVLSSAGNVNGTNNGASPLASITSAQQAEYYSNMRRTSFQRDVLGRVLTATLPDREGTRPVIRQTFDRWGNTLSRSSLYNSNSVTTYVYNANNQVILQSDPDVNGAQSTSSPITQTYYDRLGRQIAQRAANDGVSSTTYDGAGNVVTETGADGGVATHYYDAFNEQVGLRDQNGYLRTAVLDRMGRIIQTSTPAVGVYTVSSSNVLSGSTQVLTASMSYDEAGRLRYKIDGAGQRTSYDYDQRGNVLNIHSPDGTTEQFAYDTQGKKIADVDANRNVATWTYDYFGEVQSRRDIGGATYSYSYDAARQLYTETNSRGGNISYAYNDAGDLVQITDNAIGKVTLTAYNSAGQEIRERIIQKGRLYQDSQLAYNAQGQLARVDATNNGVTVLLNYDQMGNLVHRQTITTAHGAATTYQYITYPSGSTVYVSQEIAAQSASTENLWTAYDAMGRQLETDGANNGNVSDASNVTPTQGHIQTYDKAGNRISDTSWGKELVAVVSSTGSVSYQMHEGMITRYYQYDAANRLVSISLAAYDTSWHALTTNAVVIEQRYYDALGRLVQDGAGDQLPAAYKAALAAYPDQLDNFSTTQYHYGANEQLSSRRTTKLDGTQRGLVTYTSYDSVGNQLAYTAVNDQGQSQQVQITQAALDGYRQQSVVNTVTSSAGTKTTRTQRGYDANSFLITTTITDPNYNVSTKQVVNDANGNVVYGLEKGVSDNYLIASGQVLDVWQGTSTNGSTLLRSGGGTTTADASTATATGAKGAMLDGGSADALMVSDPGDSSGGGGSVAMPAGRVVGYDESGNALIALGSGDTLQSLAQQAYGDANKWYLIANANGISGNTSLAVGTRLIIPTKDDASGTTFHSTDPAVAGTSESNFWSLAPAPKPAQSSGGGGGHCGALGKVLMVVVAVAVTYVTVGAASAFVGEALGAAGASTATAAAVGGIAGQAIGAAAGSIASQAVGMATGDVDHFSLKAVGTAALSAGISAGVTSAIPVPAAVQGDGFLATAGRTVIQNVETQAIGTAVGLQDGIDFKGAVAAGVGAGVGSVVSGAVGGALQNTDLDANVQKVITSGASGIASGTTTAVLRGGSVDETSVLTDAFGNLLGNSLGEAVASSNSDDGDGNKRPGSYQGEPGSRGDNLSFYGTVVDDHGNNVGIGATGDNSGYSGGTLPGYSDLGPAAAYTTVADDSGMHDTESGFLGLSDILAAQDGDTFGSAAGPLDPSSQEYRDAVRNGDIEVDNGPGITLNTPNPVDVNPADLAGPLQIDPSVGQLLTDVVSAGPSADAAASEPVGATWMADEGSYPSGDEYRFLTGGPAAAGAAGADRLSPDEIALAAKYLNGATNNEPSTSTTDTRKLVPTTGLSSSPFSAGARPASGPVSAVGGFDMYGNSINGSQFDLGKSWVADIPKVPINLFANTTEFILNGIGAAFPGNPDYVPFMNFMKVPYNSHAGEVMEFGLGLYLGESLASGGLGKNTILKESAPNGVGKIASEATSGIDIQLTYKSEWTDAQVAEADEKVKLLNQSNPVVSDANRSGTSASARYSRSGASTLSGYDVDHILDLQLGGADNLSNMWLLDSSVNRSLGKQIQLQIKNAPIGTPINSISIGPK